MESPTEQIAGDGSDSVVYVDADWRTKYHYADEEGMPICGCGSRDDWATKTVWHGLDSNGIIRQERVDVDTVVTREKEVEGMALCVNCKRLGNSERTTKEAYWKLVDVAGITREGVDTGLTKMQMEELIRKFEDGE